MGLWLGWSLATILSLVHDWANDKEATEKRAISKAERAQKRKRAIQLKEEQKQNAWTTKNIYDGWLSLFSFFINSISDCGSPNKKN